MRCPGQAPLHQHVDTGVIHALAGDGQTNYTVILGDLARCSCPAGELGQRCFHITSAEACFAAFFTAPWAASEQSSGLFEQIRAKLSIVAGAPPARWISDAQTEPPADARSAPPVAQRFMGAAELPICTENPPCVRLEMTPAIAAALAGMEEPGHSSRPASAA